MDETIINESLTNLKFKHGVKDGLPIGLGYLSVSIALGVTAVSKGIPVLVILLMSMTNLTSAGQYASIGIIADVSGTFLSIIITQFVINIRYFLMSISLSQKLDDSFTLKSKLFCSFAITDEIFGVASSKHQPLTVKYYLGLMLLPYLGWSLGTLLGAIAGNIMPDIIVSALGIALFSMFIAIMLPPATKHLGVFIVILISSGLSCLFCFTDILPKEIQNLSYILCAITACLIVAIIFPIKEGQNEQRT